MCAPGTRVVPEASVLHSAEMRVQKGGPHLGRIFWLPREQTMVSWNNAADESLSKENKALTSWVLKAHSWANTLSCYNQASVNFHCRLKLRKRENLLQWFRHFFFTFFNLTANIPIVAQGSTVHLLDPCASISFYIWPWLTITIKCDTRLLVNLSWSTHHWPSLDLLPYYMKIFRIRDKG